MEPRKHYTKEFKLDAISLELDQGLTIAEAARSLGIREKWIQLVGHQRVKVKELFSV